LGRKGFIRLFNKWTKDKSVAPSLATITIWYIWIERNRAIFENLQPSIKLFSLKCWAFLSNILLLFQTAPLRDCNLLYLDGFSLAFFDGASQKNKAVCGAGGEIKTFDSRVFRWTLNGGAGTNTKVELLGIWATLTLSSHLSLPKIQACGDSRVIIDWLNGKANLQGCSIEGWKRRIQDLIKDFQATVFTMSTENSTKKQINYQNHLSLIQKARYHTTNQLLIEILLSRPIGIMQIYDYYPWACL
jgi:ribonuclease HI